MQSVKPRRRLKPRHALAAGIACLMVVSACGGASTGTGDGESDQATLRFSWWGSDERQQMTQGLIDRFEEEHPDITVKAEFTGWDDYWDRLATSTAGGNMPDIMQHESRYVREYSDRGALLDLSEYMPDVIDPSAFDESVLSTGEVDGATYAIPTGVNAYSIVADPEIFEQAGLDMPDDETWTWEDLISIAGEITANTPADIHGVQDWGFVDAGFEAFARQRGESLWDEDTELGFSEETLTEWWNLLVEARDSKATPRPSLTVETQAGGVDQSLVATNNGAMGFWWTNQLPTLSESSGRDLQLLRLPGESENDQAGMFYKPAMFWAASARTEHPEEAAVFIDWLLNAPEVAELQLVDRGLPMNTDLREQIADQVTPADQQATEFMDEIAADISEPPALPPAGGGEVQTSLAQLHEQVLFDQITVDEAVQQFRSQAMAAVG